jgi:hypothetical protein
MSLQSTLEFGGSGRGTPGRRGTASRRPMQSDVPDDTSPRRRAPVGGRLQEIRLPHDRAIHRPRRRTATTSTPSTSLTTRRPRLDCRGAPRSASYGVRGTSLLPTPSGYTSPPCPHVPARRTQSQAARHGNQAAGLKDIQQPQDCASLRYPLRHTQSSLTPTHRHIKKKT